MVENANNSQLEPGGDYFYPLLFLRPEFDRDILDCAPYRLARRKWETSTFDLATLATRHKLHLPYQAMDVLLSRCNSELCVSGQRSLAEANDAFQAMRVALYSTGVSPFLCPFVTTYSINDYSGINSRDSEHLRAKMYPGMEAGLRSDAGTLEAWPLELSFRCTVIGKALGVTTKTFTAAAEKAAVWQRLLGQNPKLRALTDAAVAAPTLGDPRQSILHIWSALEALFPSVNTEVSFRMAMYIAQLASSGPERLSYYETVRGAYNTRCQIAHGARSNVEFSEWDQAWSILIDCLNAVHQKERLPTEKELLAEILG